MLRPRLLARPGASALSAALAAVLALALLLAGCGEDEPSGDKAGAGASQGKEPAPGAGSKNEGQATPDGCRQVDAPEPKPDGGEQKPGRKLDRGKRYEVVVRTNCGSFTIRLDQRASPATAASFAALTEKGFFDGTVFHRIVPGFVIQGGDPTASGSGGPGYSTRDEPPAGTAYTKGVVAMAKAAEEPPGTAGSQFYVVTGEDARLEAEYAILGKVSAGLAVAERIAELGDPASGSTGTPLQTVVIEKATLRTG